MNYSFIEKKKKKFSPVLNKTKALESGPMCHMTSYPASAWRSWLCRRAVRVKSGRMASRLVSRSQWAAMRSGVTMTTGSTAEGASCWESGGVMQSLVSVSLWPVGHIDRELRIETPQQRFTHRVHHICM